MSSRVIVTGCAGFIGSHVCERLLARGDYVFGIDNFHPFYPRRFKTDNMEGFYEHSNFFFDGRSIAGCDAVTEALAGATQGGTHPCDIIHLAAIPGVRQSWSNPSEYLTMNVLNTVRFLEEIGQYTARMGGSIVRHFVFTSSSSVYGMSGTIPFKPEHPTTKIASPYAASKLAAEGMVSAYGRRLGIKTTILRLFTVYGPRQRPEMAIHLFTRKILRGEQITLFGDASARDYTYIADAVSGIVGALDRNLGSKHETYNIGSREVTHLDKLVEMLGSVLGEFPLVIRSVPQAGDVTKTYADIGKSIGDFRYEPTTTLRTGLAQFVEWYRKKDAEGLFGTI